MMSFFTSDSGSNSLKQRIIFSFAVIGATKLTFYIDLAVWDGPLLSTLQQVIHASLGRTHCDLADLVWERKSQIDRTFLGKTVDFLEMFPETHKKSCFLFFFSSPIGWLGGTGCDEAAAGSWASTWPCWRWCCGRWTHNTLLRSPPVAPPLSRGCNSPLHTQTHASFCFLFLIQNTFKEWRHVEKGQKAKKNVKNNKEQ